MSDNKIDPRFIAKRCRCSNILRYEDYLPGGIHSAWQNIVGITDTQMQFEDMEYRCTNCGELHKFDFQKDSILEAIK